MKGLVKLTERAAKLVLLTTGVALLAGPDADRDLRVSFVPGRETPRWL
jgi:hypothetical protein